MDALEIGDRSAKRPGLVVLLSGTFTSLGTLAAIYVLSSLFEGFHPMGFYVNYVIPFGAILVGLVAGSGYGIGSWLTGVKISGRLLLLVILFQIGAYFMAQNVEYLIVRSAFPKGVDISFWTYFDTMTRAFAWQEDGKAGEPFGAWGYGIRALEIAGFALGGIVAPAILFAVPYCEQCRAYMKAKELAVLPAGVAPKRIKKNDTAGQEAYQAELAAALAAAQGVVERIMAAAGEGDAQGFVDLVREKAGKPREMNALTSRITVTLERCSRCSEGNVVLRMITGMGENITKTELGRAAVDAAFAEQAAGLVR